MEPMTWKEAAVEVGKPAFLWGYEEAAATLSRFSGQRSAQDVYDEIIWRKQPGLTQVGKASHGAGEKYQTDIYVFAIDGAKGLWVVASRGYSGSWFSEFHSEPTDYEVEVVSSSEAFVVERVAGVEINSIKMR